MIAKKHGHDRELVDRFSLESHRRAVIARDSGAFEKEIVAIKGRDHEGNEVMHKHDEGIRPGTMEKLATLKILMDGGVLTAANASQICDGSSSGTSFGRDRD